MVSNNEYQKVPLHSSNYFDECWIRLNGTSNISANISMKTDFWLPESDSVLAALVFAVVGLCGTFLNSLVIASLLRSAELRKGYLTPSVVSIAITDLIFSLVGGIYGSTHFFIRDVPLPSGCQAFALIYYVLWMCSALNLLGIAVLRCVLVYHPQKTKNGVFWKATKIMPIMTWVLSLVWLLPTLVGKYGQFGLDCKMLSCWFINQDVSGHKANPELTYCSAIMVTGIVVFFLNLLAYAKIVDYTKSFLSTNSSAELEAKKKY